MSADSERSEPLVLQVRVKPRASGEWVGGTWGDENGPLNVWVTKPAVDGQANKAVEALLASSMLVRKRQVSVIQGNKSRTKTIQIEDPPAGSADRLTHWKTRR